jgi:hypothetical protein
MPPWNEIVDWAQAFVAIIIVAFVVIHITRAEKQKGDINYIAEEDETQDSEFATVATAAKR